MITNENNTSFPTNKLHFSSKSTPIFIPGRMINKLWSKYKFKHNIFLALFISEPMSTINKPVIHDLVMMQSYHFDKSNICIEVDMSYSLCKNRSILLKQVLLIQKLRIARRSLQKIVIILIKRSLQLIISQIFILLYKVEIITGYTV